jgi:XcyI restriction endonuclease.
MTAPSADRQVTFHTLLVAARNQWLMDAMSEALKNVEPATLKAEIVRLVPADVQKILAGAGVRDEHVFPTPSVLRAAPSLVGYYRLLLGSPQKTFYGTGTGMGQVKSMETSGTINAAQEGLLEAFCEAMCASLAELVRKVSPTITDQDVRELPLLTLGSQFQGGNNNTIGKAITDGVFKAIAAALDGYVIEQTAKTLEVQNDAGEVFVVTLASDPDVTIQKRTDKDTENLVAIEIKGGTDDSNAHNRAGEAEKSHIKAKKDKGYGDCWTLFQVRELDQDTLAGESPTTDAWFDVSEVVAQEGDAWDEFCEEIKSIMGIDD